MNDTFKCWLQMLAALIIDLLIFSALTYLGCKIATAHVLAFLGAIFFYFDLTNYRAEIEAQTTKLKIQKYSKLLIPAILMLGLRGGVLQFCLFTLALPKAIGFAAVLLATWWTSRYITEQILVPGHVDKTSISAHIPGLALVIYAFLIRLLYLGGPELMPEEAYYWQYAQHLAPGYLDHPPMIAWLIAIGTKLFGDSEFGVRIGALACWVVCSLFVSLLAERLYDRATAKASAVLMSIFPYFFWTGFVIFPEAPLCACWAGALYFAHCALSNENKRPYLDWIMLGLCLGFGMLSKYSIALLGFSIVLFALSHKPVRRVFRMPAAYLALGIALLLFSPVIYWNATNDWASFAFQSTRRLNEQKTSFGTPALFAWMLLLVTPTGFMVALNYIYKGSGEAVKSKFTDFDIRFARFTALFPFAIFFLFSLRHEPKANWIAPLFIVLVPAMAKVFTSCTIPSDKFTKIIARSWVPTFISLLLVYVIALHYLALSLPMLGYSPRMSRFIGWMDLSSQIKKISDSIHEQTGSWPVIVGMDKHIISSEIGFYLKSAQTADASELPEVAGRNIFSLEALMWRFWSPSPESIKERDLILVARTASDLELKEISSFVERLDPIVKISTLRNGSSSGTYYYRLAHNYRALKN